MNTRRPGPSVPAAFLTSGENFAMAKKSAFFRLVRLVKWGLVLVAAGTFAAISSLYILVSPEWMTERLADFSESRLGLQLKLSDNVTIRHLPKVEVEIPAGTFFDPADGEQVGSFRAARLKISPWGLAIGQIHVSRAEIEGLKSGIKIPDAEGLRAWANSPLFTTESHWIEPVVVRKFVLLDSDIGIERAGAAPALLHVKQLETSELAPRMSPDITFSATLSDSDAAFSANIDAQGRADFDMASQIFGVKDFSLASRGTLKGSAFTASAATETFQYTHGVTTSPAVNASFIWETASPAKFTARVTGLATQGGSVTGKIEKLEAVQKLPGGTQSAQLASDFSYADAEKTVSLPSLSLECTVAADNLPALDASLTGNATASFASPAFNLAAEGVLNGAPLKLSGGWALAPAPEVKLSITADSLDLSPKAVEAEALDVRTLLTGALEPLSDALGVAKLDAGIAVKALKNNSLEITDFAASLSLEKGALAVRGIQAGLYGGTMKGVLSAAPDGSWSSEMALAGIKYDALARAFETTPRIKGTLEVQFELQGTDLASPSPMKTLSGNVQFEVKEGEIEGIRKEALPFEAITGRAELQNGIASCQDLRLRSKEIEASGSVELDLRTLAIAGDTILRAADARSVTASLDGTVFRPEWVLSEPLEREEPATAEARPEPQATPSGSSPVAASPAPAKDSPWYERLKGWAESQLHRF